MKKVLLDVIGRLVVDIPFAQESLPLGEVVTTSMVELDSACGKDGMDLCRAHIYLLPTLHS